MTITIRALAAVETHPEIPDDALIAICERLGITVYEAGCGAHIAREDMGPLGRVLEVRAVLIERGWTPDAVDGILPCLWKTLSGKLPRELR